MLMFILTIAAVIRIGAVLLVKLVTIRRPAVLLLWLASAVKWMLWNRGSDDSSCLTLVMERSGGCDGVLLLLLRDGVSVVAPVVVVVDLCSQVLELLHMLTRNVLSALLLLLDLLLVLTCG